MRTDTTTEISAAENSRSAFPENLPPAWRDIFRNETSEEYFQKLSHFLKSEQRSGKTVFPKKENILRALREVDLPDVRVVILGQDPYHGPNQAIGRSFAVPNELRVKPPSLKNIYKELASDLGIQPDTSLSDLSGWVKQGVFLLNTILSVRAGEAFSHRDRGWEIFTDKVIRSLGQRDEALVFILWGAAAQKKKELIQNSRHLILESPHPSPFSANRGFFGCRHFSKTNEFLLKHKLTPIDWSQLSSESLG